MSRRAWHTPRARRLCVAGAVAITAVFGAPLPASLHGWGIVAVVVLVTLDMLLLAATGGLAFARGRSLDERERALRDLAYRRGFRLLGLAAVLEVVLLIAASIVGGVLLRGQPMASVVDGGLSGRGLVALAEVLAMTPTLVIAWIAPAAEADERSSRGPGRLQWLLLPGVVSAWLVVLTLAPDQVAAASGNLSFASFDGATCQQFAGGRITGAQFGATVGWRVEVCWNGHDAFVIGNPAIPLPPSAIAGMEAQIPLADRPSPSDAAMFNPAQPELTACGQDDTEDFATLSALTCAGRIDASGTLHYAVHAIVTGPFGVGRHHVTLDLVVDRHGTVLQRP